MSDVSITDLIAKANRWRNEDPNADSTEQVSEEVTSLIARLADALEFVTDNYVLKSWSGLFEILNEAYPEDVFLTLPNNESRDSGPRIISLIRLLDREKTRAEIAESRLEAVTAPSENEREALAETIAAWQGRHTQANTLPSSIELADSILARFRLPVPVEPEWEYDAGWRAPNGEIESNGEWSDDKDFSLDILAYLLNSNGSYEDSDNTSDIPFLIRRTKAGIVEPIRVVPQPHEGGK